MPEIFQYKRPDGGLGVLTVADIMNMTMPEFLYLKDKLVNVRERTRYDRVIWENVIITPAMEHESFRKGYGQKEKYASSDTEYLKTKFNTNMSRNGEFDQGSLVIIYDIAAPKAFTAGKPGTVAANGSIANPKATFAATNDPSLVLEAWLEQTELVYREGDSEDGICRGLLKEFSANNGQSGFLGSSVGGVAQNLAIPNVNLRQPRIIEGGQDFSVLVKPLANFDASAATGIDQFVVQKIELKTIELVRVPN